MNELRSLIKIPLMLLTWMLYRVKQIITPLEKKDPQMILVLYLSGMGDILCASPFLKRLKDRFPHTELHGCLPVEFVNLQKDFFRFDKYIAHRNYHNTLKQINTGHYDMIIIPGWLMRNSVLALVSNARSIIGYINDLSFSNRYLNSFFLEAVGLKAEKKSQDMRTSHLSERANLILEHFGVSPIRSRDLQIERQFPAEDYTVIHAGAGFEGRRWPEKRFAKVINHLLDTKICAEVRLIGDGFDSDINRRILSILPGRNVIDHAGKINLYQSKEIISKAKLFIGNDSGPMHIAALCGIPSLGLLGPNFPHISGPLGTRSVSVWHIFPCSGCNQRGCAFGYRCMKSITAEEVITAINSLLTDI
ncbi:MAG: glycosyltransferase family 9 protein [Candidatus Cloacimonadaceae bacterium]|nr:glycosyltransferase family 9 protein [Candidatus Cloacimonadaceae bacterium]